MSDDLDTFFAKKKSKDKKKKNALHVGDIAEYLDQSNRHHEILEREENEYLQRQSEKEAKDAENGEEESEWLEANDDIQFEEIGVKDMDISELTEDEEEQETKVEANPAKTWSNPVTVVTAPVTQYNAAPKKYVPPTNRVARRGNTDFDLKNEEMFPSIANADKIEKVEKIKVEDRKQAKVNQQAGWKTQGEPKTNAYRPPQTRTITPSAPSVPKPTPPPAATTAPPKTNKYIPPSKRNQQ